jgi:hypothetical protein
VRKQHREQKNNLKPQKNNAETGICPYEFKNVRGFLRKNKSAKAPAF